MNDHDIRAALKAEFMQRCIKDDDTFVLEELGIKHGIARIDLVIMNHQLHGYEIKSDLDSLKRLPHQIMVFSSVMDRMTLVVGYKHAYDALKMVPEWWGVRLAEKKRQGGNVVFSEARPALGNPKVNLYAVAALLWRNEALAILDEIGAANGVRSKRRSEVYKRLVDLIDPDSLRFKTRQTLKFRKGWRVGAQQMSYGD